MTKISIIIPVYNEANSIAKLIDHLNEKSSDTCIEEIIVVDGSSTDNTTKVIASFPDIVVLQSAKGRAIQMNTGASMAKGDILYFLHADSFPPNNYDALIKAKINDNYKAGCFRMKFDSDHWWLKLSGWFTQFNWKFCRGGDQSLFVTKQLFNDLEGFDENYIIYEDNAFIKKLYKHTEFAVINKPIITSARRYKKHGVWTLQKHYWTIHLKHFFGASASDLHQFYKKKIAN
ncbi:MAG: TIGR04283 family arsenosugar biosynthesis glycosyltransferase [Bacteroidia bacterium]|nr:TIGR04283 family arsenosugar biosynthesis glycosyltransferase [Bacteroidia bacterium]